MVGTPVLLLYSQHARTQRREPCRRGLEHHVSSATGIIYATRGRYVLRGHTVEMAESASSKVSAVYLVFQYDCPKVSLPWAVPPYQRLVGFFSGNSCHCCDEFDRTDRAGFVKAKKNLERGKQQTSVGKRGYTVRKSVWPWHIATYHSHHQSGIPPDAY